MAEKLKTKNLKLRLCRFRAYSYAFRNWRYERVGMGGVSMKRLLTAIILILGLTSWALIPVPEISGQEETDTASISYTEATRACPNCSGDAYTVRDVVFYAGDVCECVGTKSLTIGPNVTVQGGATVTFKAPTVGIVNGARFLPGSVVNIVRQVGPAASLTLSAAPQSVVADGVQKSTLSAVVKDAAGNNVADGTDVYFYTNRGLLSARSAKTTGGTAQVAICSTKVGDIGTARVTASTATGISKNIDVQFVSDMTAIALSVNPTEIPSDGSTYSIVTATMTNSKGDPAMIGTSVTFKTTWGSFSNGLQTRTFTLYDNTGLMADFLTGTSHGTANITVSSGTITSPEKTVLIYSDDPNTVTVGAAPSTLTADGKSTSTITLVATNAVGEYVADGTAITVTAKYGALSSGTATTKNGVATVTYTSPYGVPTGGKDTVTATTGNATGTKDIILVAASVGEVTVIAGSQSVVADGASGTIIRATVMGISGANIPDGTVVTFFTTAGSLESLAAAGDVVKATARATSITAETSGGIAQVTLKSATNLGTATVTATCGGVNGSASVTFVAGPVDTVTVTANPANLSAGSSTLSTIQATATDKDGNPSSGETIAFTALFGSLSNAAAVTNASGIATVTYTAPKTVPTGGKDTITAKSTNGKSGPATITLIAATVGSVTVTAGSSSLLADGSSATTIFATVKDVNGNNVADGTSVTFATTAGTLSGATTTTNGIARVTLTSGTNPGTAVVTTTCGGFSDTVSIVFVAGPASQVLVTADPSNLTADGVSTSTIRVVVLDVNDNPVTNGTAVTFTVDYGTLSSLNGVTTNGALSVTYTVPSAKPAGDQATVTARTVNGANENAAIHLIGAQIATISLTANPESLPADEASTATISATLTVVGGGNPPDGTSVNFSIIRGGGSITSTATSANGVASATLTSGNVAETATIQAEAGGRTAQIDIDYTPGSVTLSIVPNALLGTGEKTATVTVQLKNANGTPAPDGETVRFSLSDESLGDIPASALTAGGEGKAQVTFEAAAKGGTVTVTGTWTTGGVDVSGTADIVIYPPPAFIQVADGYPSPTSVNVKGTGGQSTSQIVFEVKDAAGELVADGYRIDFSILSGPNGGEEISPVLTTTSGGKAGTILTSGFKSGPVSVKGTYFHDTNVTTTTGDIAIVSGPPVGEELGIQVQYVNVSGLWKMGLRNGVTVNAGDIYGNAVPDNTAISFKTYNTGGLFNPGSDGTSGGFADSDLVSVASPSPMQGFVSITGEAINGGRTTHVTAMAVDPVSSNVVFAATDGGGVYKSTDAGVTWRNVSSSSTVPGQNWIDPYVNDVAVDPENNNTVYAATGYLGDGHVYRSLDGGSSWNSNNAEEFAGLVTIGNAVLTILCDDASDYVWIGANGAGAYLSTDGKTFQVGGLVAPIAPTAESVPGTFDNPANTGDGTMTEPIFTANSKTENWTLTYAFPEAFATTPEAGVGNTGDGSMSSVVTSNEKTLSETWTVSYGATAGTVTPNVGNTGDGAVGDIQPGQPNGASETWTLTCIDNTIAGSEIFQVRSVSGGNTHAYPNATVDSKYSQTTIVFLIISGATDYAVGDEFTFTVTADWQVSGTVSGIQTAKATTGVLYASDDNEVQFTISAGSQPFAVNDRFTFSTTAPTPYWTVVGTVSGTQDLRAYNNTKYISDNDEISFTITEGATAFAVDDAFTFSVTDSGLGHGKVVRDMVKAPGTHGATAVLYAATATGVFRSTDGGSNWIDISSFTGDNINTLALHPDSDGATDIIYAGTNDAGVYVSADTGTTWTPYTGGMGRGLSASTPVPGTQNTGTGVMSRVTVGNNALSEYWTITCKTAVAGKGVFSVIGTVSGSQPDYDISTGAYTIADVMTFTITAGSTDFVVGDTFTFRTTRDPGREIKDLLVDEGNNRLYAVTYFWGAIEPHAVGNLYMVELNAATHVPTGDWAEAVDGLPSYDPPDDTTLFAQHALASNVPPYASGAASALYIGGEGINLYKATSNLATGDPQWQQSDSGLTNRIMARMPALFSGVCTMEIAETHNGGDSYTYTIYIQDVNGNPPIEGTTFTVTTHDADGALIRTVRDLTYPDTRTYQGTWRDPSDASTNDPYIVDINFTGLVAEVKFSFTPTCEDAAPGCSGSNEEVSYIH